MGLPRRIRHLTARVAVITAFLVIVAFIAGIAFFSSTRGENYIRTTLETRLSTALGLTLTIGSFETNVLSHVVVHDVAAVMPDGMMLASFPSGTVHYSLLDLVTLRLSLSSITLDSLRVTIHRDSTGTLVLPGNSMEPKDSTESGKSPIAIHLGRITLNGAELTWDDMSIPLDCSLQGIDARVRSRFTGGYDIRVRAREGSLTHGNLPAHMTSLNISAVYDGGVVSVSQVGAMIGETRLTGSAEIDTNTRPVTVMSQYAVNGPVKPVVMIFDSLLPDRLKPLSGNILVTGTINYDNGGLRAALAASGSYIGIGELRIPALALQGRYIDRWVAIDSLHVTTQADGIIFGEGSVQLDSLLTHRATIRVDGIHADRVWQVVHGTDSPYTASIDADLTSAGPLRDILNATMTASLHTTGIRYHDRPFTDIAINFRYFDRVLSLTTLQNSSRAECALTIEDDNLDGEFFGDIAQIELVSGFFDDLDLTGAATVTGTIGGTLDMPDISAVFHGRDVKYRGFPADSIHGALSYHPGSFRLEPTTVTGRIDSVSTLTYPSLPVGLTGEFDYNGSFSYGDEGFSGDITFMFNAPGYRDINFTTGTATVAIRDTLVTLTQAQLNADSLAIGVSGEYSIPGQELFLTATAYDSTGQAGAATVTAALGDTTGQQISIGMDRIDVARVRSLFPGLPGISGTVDGSILYYETPDGPEVAAHVTVDSLAMSRIILDRMEAGGSLTGNTVRLDSLKILTPSGTLDAAGSLAITRTTTGELTVTNTSRTQGWIRSGSIDVALAAAYLPEQSSVTGAVTADVQWDGTFADPGLSGRITLDDGTFQSAPEASPIDAIETSLRLDHSDIIIERLSASSQGVTLDSTGKITVLGFRVFDTVIDLSVNGTEAFHGEGMYDNGEVDGSLRFADFDLVALQGISPAVTHLSGTVQGDISIDGTPSLANMKGRIITDGLTFRPASLNESVTNGYISITLDNEQAYLDTLSLALGGGKVTGSGIMTLDNNTPRDMSLALRGNDITLKKNNMYDIHIDSVMLSGSATESGVVLDGDMVFGETRLTRTVRTRDIIQFTREKTARSGTPRPIIDTARLNIRVRDSEDIWIDNNMAKLKVHPELVIIGTPRTPIITGRFTADEGYIYYLDRKFDLTRCYIDFTDPNRNNPMLDIQASTSVRSSSQLSEEPFVISLTISGEAEDPRFDLTSNPALDQADILSVLTFGATRSELAGSSGTILQDRAQMLGSQQISNYLSREARSFLGLDDLSIQGNLFNAGKAAGPQLLASDNISDRLRITYTTTVGEQNEQSIRLDYQLSRFFSVEGQTNQDGDSGLDLKYRIKF